MTKSFSFQCLTLSQTLVFTCLLYKSLENTVGKGEIARNEQFLLFPHCFLTYWKTFSHVHQISNCRLQTLSIWKSKKFVVWERVKSMADAKLIVAGITFFVFGYKTLCGKEKHAFFLMVVESRLCGKVLYIFHFMF